MLRACSCGLAAALVLALAPPRASAATVLFVTNVGGDTNIPATLTADGHVVVSGAVADLGGDLSDYEVIVWSATSSSSVPSTTFMNLQNWVESGGRLFVTGFMSVTSNSELAALCGASGATFMSWNPPPSEIPFAENSLTTGIVDIRGVTPTGGAPNEALTGLGPDTVQVAASSDMSGAQWTLRRIGAGEIAFVSNGTFGTSHPSWDAGGEGGAAAYSAALRNFVFHAEVMTSEAGAPHIEFDGPRTVPEGEALVVSVRIEDREGDSYTFSWDLDGDGTFGENEGADTYTLPADTTDGPALLRVGVQAVDSEGHTAKRYRNLYIANVAPRVVSEPPTVTGVEIDFRYQLVVEDPAGDRDTLTFTMAQGPARMAVSPEGIVQWTPQRSDVTRPGQPITVEVLVTDEDGGETSHQWEMEVVPNRPPTRPQPAYPIDMVVIVDPTPRLAVANAQDLDLDPLVYYFQLDTTPTFDSPDLRESGPIDEMPGFTAWQIEEPLTFPSAYYWRVWANDGLVDSEVGEGAFYVVRDPRLPEPDAGVPDAGLTDGGLIPGVDAGLDGSGGGCSCRASGRGRSGAPMIVLACFALWIARRRSRIAAATDRH